MQIKGKGGKVRFIPLNDEARAVLETKPRLTASVFNIPNRNSAGRLCRVTEMIFRGTRVDFSLHLFQHSFASRLLEAWVDFVTISQLLGHSAYMTTLLYPHSSRTLEKASVITLVGRTRKSVPVRTGGA